MIAILSCWYPLVSIIASKNQFTITASGYCPVNTPGQSSVIQVEYQSETTFNAEIQLMKNQKKYTFTCALVEGITEEECIQMLKQWQWYPMISISAIMTVPHTDIEGVQFQVETGPCFAFVIGPTFWIIIAVFTLLIAVRSVFCTFYLRQYWTALYQREVSEKKAKQQELEVKQIDQ